MKKVIRGERFRSKTVSFLLRWPLEAKPLTLGQIWRNLSDGQINYLSNSVFGFAITQIVSEIMDVVRSNVWQSRKTRKFVFVFHVFVRPCGHSSFRTNETRHMAEIHEVKHTAEIHTRNKTHGRDKEQRTTKLLPDKRKKTGTQICGKWALMPKCGFKSP